MSLARVTTNAPDRHGDAVRWLIGRTPRVVGGLAILCGWLVAAPCRAQLRLPDPLKERIGSLQEGWKSGHRDGAQGSADIATAVCRWIGEVGRESSFDDIVSALHDAMPVRTNGHRDVTGQIGVESQKAHDDEPISASAALWRSADAEMLFVELQYVAIRHAGNESLENVAPLILTKRSGAYSVTRFEQVLGENPRGVLYRWFAFFPWETSDLWPDILVSGGGGTGDGATLWQLHFMKPDNAWRIVWNESWLFVRAADVDFKTERLSVTWGHARGSAEESVSTFQLRYGQSATLLAGR